MSQIGTTYIRKPNTMPDEEFCKHLLENAPKAWGAVVLDKGVLDTFYGESLDVESMMQTFEEFKDCTAVFYFCDSDAAINVDKHVPPFTVIANDDDENLVCIIPEGNFPGFEKAGSSAPPIYHLGEHLCNEFYGVYDLVDKDLDKFMKAIQKDSFKAKVQMNAVGRGYVTVIARNGQVLTFQQGDPPVEFDHGYVTNAFGFGKKEEAKEEPKKRGMFSRSTTREKHVPASNNVVAAGADKPPKTETAVKAPSGSVPEVPEKPKKNEPLTIENVQIKSFKIPDQLSRKLRRNWIKERLGYIPEGIDDPKSVYKMYVKPDGGILTRDQINRMFGLSAASLPKLEGNPPPVSHHKDTGAHNLNSEITQPHPILSGATRERARAFISDTRIQKIIGENASIITDPENVQGTEAKIPLFYMQVGEKDMSQWDALPFIEIEKLGRADIHMLAVMAHTWRLRALRAELKLGKSKDVAGKMQQQLQEAGDAVAQPEEPEKVEEPKEEAPKARGMFSRKKVA